MKQFLLSVFFVLFATVANAHQTGTITAVYPNYVQREVTQYGCENIPVYGNGYASGGDIVAGAIIGGIIGNQFGSGSGNDAMTALGAIVGAESASKGSRQIIGYREQCNVPYTSYQNIQDGYIVEYNLNGRFHSFHTYDHNYRIGQTVIVRR